MAPSGGLRLTPGAATYLINHIVLPPKLPHEDDSNISHEQALLDAVTCALQDLRNCTNDAKAKEDITTAISAVSYLGRSRDSNGHVSELQLRKLLQNLISAINDEVMPLEIKAQNAGLIISRSGDSVIFEPFELSPCNKAAMGAVGRLVRTFPGCASKVPLATMKEEAFIQSLTFTLAKMSTQTAPGFQPQVRKTGKLLDENRDTTNPGLVTDWLINYIAALGSLTETARISKNTREEVLWRDCLKPWRRTPLWLLVRVVLQLLFARKGYKEDSTRPMYKLFIVHLLSRLLGSVNEQRHVTGSETLYLTYAKLARRVRKLENLCYKKLLDAPRMVGIQAAMTQAYALIKEDWTALTRSSNVCFNPELLRTLQPAKDLDMSLPELDSDLNAMADRSRSPRRADFVPDEDFPTFPHEKLPTIVNSTGGHGYYCLAALEAWIEQYLDLWLSRHVHEDGSCGKLRVLMELYHQAASAAYAGIPVALSVMYLSLAELWVACDKSACRLYPLLCEYSPEVDLTELQCILLPHKSQMIRLYKVERYAESRHGAAINTNPSVLRNFGHPLSFAVKYFDQSTQLQELLSKVRSEAAQKQKQKLEELIQLKKKYENLMDYYNTYSCETRQVVYNRYHGYSKERHKPGCSRCVRKAQAESLSIDIYEWPVSAEEIVAKATIFELQLPEDFGDWRDASAFLMTTVFRHRVECFKKPRSQYTLRQHDNLSHMLSSHYSKLRIIPLSQIKPHTVTHRKRKTGIPNLHSHDVCLPNALQYAYFDNSLGGFTGVCSSAQFVVQNCTYGMPSDRSKPLEGFLHRPSSLDDMPPNQVIASLSSCPAHFSLDEYKSFGALPLGRNIIYWNILAQLAIPSIDFTKSEAQTLLLQVTEQTGTGNGSSSRLSHSILVESSFGGAILKQVEISLQRVSENWESWRAVATFVVISRRVLTLTECPEVRIRSLSVLAKARAISMKWLSRLKSRAAASTDDTQRAELYSRVTEIALLCSSTFDVDRGFLDNILQQDSAISALVQCSILLQENHSSVVSESQPVYNAMLHSWRSLMHRAFVRLRHHILQGDMGLHAAVLENWADFHPAVGLCWKILSNQHEHWLQIKSGSLSVCFNLLTAQLLVDGLPLTRLPPEFMQHSAYLPLFGKSILSVAPTDRPGMEFSAKSTYRDYKLHFDMRGSDMQVVAIKDKETYDLLPTRLFKDRLPTAFIDDYIHWYDHGRDEVTFRPRKEPWSSAGAMWKLVRKGSKWRLVNGTDVLIDIASYTARTLSKIFGPLETTKHIHVTVCMVSFDLDVQLPRLQLDFSLRHQDIELESRQYRGMIVDPDQTFGTLVGLTSRLVLKFAKSARDRLVLVPVPHTFGTSTISHSKTSGQHVVVKIAKDKAHKIFAYSLDTTLGRVLANGEIQQSLFLALLHALTSHCLPDLLTGYTGTESSLNILRSAAVRSFEFLTPANVDLLHRLAGLSPLRSFYPANIMEMQQVDWDLDLPSLSQHPEFRMCSEDIIRQAQSMQLFYPDKMPNTQDWSKSNPHLEEREAVRSSVFRVHGFGQERLMSGEDAHYKARDLYTQSDRGQRAYIATTLLFRKQGALHSTVPDLKTELLQTHFKKALIQGASQSLDLSSLRFDAQWLGDISTILKDSWCNIHQHLHASLERCNKYDIAAWLSTIGFATSADMCVLQAFAAFIRLPAIATVKPPSAPAFDLSTGDRWQAEEIENAVRAAGKAFDNSEEAKLPKQGAETNQEHNDRLTRLHRSRQEIAEKTFVTELKRQWPVAKPVPPTTPNTYAYVNVSSAMTAVTAKFQTWHRNRLFMEYLEQSSTLMTRQEAIAVQAPRAVHVAPPRKHSTRSLDTMFGIDRIFAAVPPVILRDSSLHTSVHALSLPLEPEFPVNDQQSTQSDKMRVCLEDLCNTLQNLARSKCEEEYVVRLRASCTSLQGLQTETHGKLASLSGDGAETLFRHHLEACKNYFDTINLKLLQAVAQTHSPSDEIGLKVQHSPRISPTFWLSQLHRDRFETLPLVWKTMIIEYGLAVTQLHRAQRLAAVSTKPADLMEELGHVGHSNWDPHDFPETLLLEAESGIMIRREQEFIAAQMRDTEDFINTMLQLLMGGGKSSTIVPMLAAYLTNKEILVRIIVAKPQSKQMLQMLVSKLGYLLNRRVYHMPFSRALRPNAEQADLLRKTYEECMKNRGVLLVQPEHILSFKLMAVEATLAGQNCASSLRDTQEFFQKVSRDIVDESDENFSVKFELMYTMGTQRSIELAPERWLIIQAIVGLIPRFAKEVWNKSPNSIELQRDDGGRFARVRILDNDAAEDLLTLIAKHIVEFGIIGLPTSSQSPTTQASLLQYITETNLTDDEIRAVEDSKFWTESTESPLLLVRGLIAGGVLRFALGTKRWRVNFGLDPHRIPNTLLAVPFRSKDCPSPRSEFSHPDVVILLSLLSYYYGGLTDEQLFDSFAHLLKSDQAGIHYDEWVDTASPGLPIAFRQISGVSVKDHHQCITDVFPGLRYSKKAIDYYLAFLVFPKVMKEFPQKLSASGWDIGAIKTHPMTGFSGTNDTLHLLPLAVKHLDLPSQSHTNALVLQYLLQDETSVEALPPRSEASDAQHLLSVVIRMQPEVRVILDCGALILEQNNQEVAETWLGMCHTSVQAVVFFADEELSVMDRAGRSEPLQTSPFAQQLDVCLVYLDEAHTRGTDLKLPRNYRAAVTLGQGLVKDKLTQGCMRMRKLGLGQSIAFMVPEEISTKIRERTGKPSNVPIKVSDVLCWSIGETWQDLKRSMPLWAVQGERFERHKNLLCGAATTQTQAESFLEDEAQTLEARYKPRTKEDSGMGSLKAWDLQNRNITKIVKRCQEFEAMGFGAATLNEEQERELAPEIEEEKQIDRPARLDAERHLIHPQVRQLVQTGRLTKTTKNSNAWNSAFQELKTTSAAKLSKLEEFPTELLVTSDFMRTVKAPSGYFQAEFISDSYQRPVQFILSVYKANSRIVEHLVIISPYEANELLADIRRCAEVTLHIFAPRINASFAPLDRLELYNVGHAFSPEQVPRSLTVQLNLFTGSLYLRDFNEYTELCDFLGLLRTRPVEGQQIYADGFIDPPSGTWGLKKSPVPFLRTFLTKIRREGEGVEKTHLGKILNGMRLEEVDFKPDTEISGA